VAVMVVKLLSTSTNMRAPAVAVYAFVPDKTKSQNADACSRRQRLAHASKVALADFLDQMVTVLWPKYMLLLFAQ
jgi:hypothetical protein